MNLTMPGPVSWRRGVTLLLVIAAAYRILPQWHINRGALELSAGIAHGHASLCLGRSDYLLRAERSLQQATSITGDTTDLLARVYVWQAALPEVTQTMGASHQTLSSLLDRALVDREAGHDYCALRQYRALTVLFPASSLPWYHIGIVATGNQDYGSAQTALDRCIALNNFRGSTVRLGDAYLQKGDAYRDANRILDAYQAYSAAIATESFSAPAREAYAHYKQGEMLVWMEQYAEATGPLQQAIGIDANFYNAYSLLGLAAYHLGDTDGAVDLWKRTMAIDPTYIWPYLWLGGWHQDQGECAEAAAYYHRVLEMEPGNAAALQELSVLKEHRICRTIFR